MWSLRKSSLKEHLHLRFLCVIFCAMATLFLGACAEKQAAQGDEPAQEQPVAEEEMVRRLLPSTDAAEGWKPEGEPMSFSRETLFDHINGGADIYFEYGFTTLLIQQYKKGDKSVSLEIYCMDNPRAAFGIYSYNRHPTLSAAEVGGDGTIHPNGLFFWQDRYYVDVRQLGSATIFSEEFLALAKAVARKIGADADKPAIMNLLPREHMIPRSEVLAVGFLGIDNQVYVSNENLFGLEKGESAAIARYALDQPEFSVITAQYASADACAQAFARFREHFLGAESAREDEFVAKAMPGKYHGVRRVGDILIVVANADSEKNALAALDRVSEWRKSQAPGESAK